jgi:hypothetical protein
MEGEKKMELCAVVGAHSLIISLCCMPREIEARVLETRLSDLPFVNIAGPCKGGPWRKRET